MIKNNHRIGPGCNAHAPNIVTPCELCGASLSADGSCAVCAHADDADGGFKAWLEARPLIIQQLVEKCPPNSRWFMNGREGSFDDFCMPYSYNEDGTLTVLRINRLTGELRWSVFGIDPDDLVQMRGEA